MPPDGRHLQTPWIRDQLLDWLAKLGDRGWQKENWGNPDAAASTLDEVLDFFDDSGVLDEPSGRLGYVLLDDGEVSAMMALNSALDVVLSSPAGSDEEIIRSRAWGDVVAAARDALELLGDPRQGH
ncbi:SCO4402 family protein [Streptomyces sp. NPDC055189]